MESGQSREIPRMRRNIAHAGNDLPGLFRLRAVNDDGFRQEAQVNMARRSLACPAALLRILGGRS
jgi:hypothetical protein